MAYNLDELEKKCRRYYVKRLFTLFIALAVLVSLVSWSLFYLQKAETKKTVAAPIESNISHNAQRFSTEAKCFALQMLYSKEKFRSNVEQEKNRLEKAGLDCYLKRGKTLKDGSIELFLRCNAVAAKKEIEPFLKVAKLLDKHAYIINEECRFAKKYVIVPNVKEAEVEKGSEKKNVDRQNTKKTPDNITDLKEVMNVEKTDIAALQKLFEQRKSYDLAIKVAKSFYENRKFKDALVWAKKANRINRNKEEAWILYAKSLYALGNKEQAKNILRLFLEYRNSQKAQKLLSEWK